MPPSTQQPVQPVSTTTPGASNTIDMSQGLPQINLPSYPGGYNPQALAPLKDTANKYSAMAANFSASAPDLLRQLQINLTQMYAKDNPLIQSQQQAAQSYLDQPQQAMTSMLPANMNLVNGIPLNLSPTQQSQVINARQNAALVPLAGMNQLVGSGYGQVSDAIKNAGLSFAAKSQALGNYADLAQRQYSEQAQQMATGAGLNMQAAQQGLERQRFQWMQNQLKTPEETQMNTYNDTLSNIQDIRGLISKGTPVGNLGNYLQYQNPLMRTIMNMTGHGLTANEELLGSDLLSVSTAAERGLTGRSLTTNMLKVLGPGQVSGLKNTDQLNALLDKAENLVTADATTIAKNRGYKSIQDAINHTPSTAGVSPQEQQSYSQILLQGGMDPTDVQAFMQGAHTP
jgi:hypothetical protein